MSTGRNSVISLRSALDISWFMFHSMTHTTPVLPYHRIAGILPGWSTVYLKATYGTGEERGEVNDMTTKRNTECFGAKAEQYMSGCGGHAAEAWSRGGKRKPCLGGSTHYQVCHTSRHTPENRYGMPKSMTQLHRSLFPQWVRQDVYIVAVVPMALLDIKENEWHHHR